MSVPYENLLSKPIIIIGAPRSGTTKLSKMFACHPHLALAQEPRLIWRFGNDRKSDVLRPEDATEPVRQFIRGRFAKLVHHAGRQRLVEKTPSNSLRMGFVDRVFPDCKFVHTIRRGPESVLSIREFWMSRGQGMPREKLLGRLREISLRQIPHYAKELLYRMIPRRFRRPAPWGPRIPGIHDMMRELDVLDICCLQWRMCVELACHYGRQLPADRYLEFRVEQMTPAQMNQVLAFCELEESDAVRAFIDAQYDPRGKRTVRQADAAEMKRIMEWIEPTLHWLEATSPKHSPS